MLNPPGPASVPSLHVVPSAPTPTSVAVTPIDEYDIGAEAAGAGGAAGAAGAVDGVAGVGAAMAVPAGAGSVGVGGGEELGRVGFFALPGGTCGPGVTGGDVCRRRASELPIAEMGAAEA